MPISSTDAHELTVGLIYDAAVRPALWRDVLVRLADMTDCHAGLFMLWDYAIGAGRVVAQFGHNPAYLESLVAHYLPMAPDIRIAPRMPAGLATSNAEIVPPDIFRRSAFYNEWARPQNIEDSIIAAVHRDGMEIGNLYVVRSRATGLAGPDAVRGMASFMPHLIRSFRLGLRLDLLTRRESELAATLSQLAMAVFLVDRTGHILQANTAAEGMVRSANHLKAVKRRLYAVDPNADKLLQAAIARAASRNGGGGRAGDVAVPRTGRRPLMLSVVPLSPHGGELLAKQATAAAIVMDPETRPWSNLDGIARAYGLTPAEARTLAVIVEGEGIDVAAGRLGITRATARTHLQRIFAKTLTSRQGELIRLVANAVPPLRR